MASTERRMEIECEGKVLKSYREVWSLVPTGARW